MVFVPNAFDDHFPSTKKADHRYKLAIVKQKDFLNKVETEVIRGIITLDYYHPKLEFTLRQILMGTQGQEKKTRLFLGVEENYDMSVKIAYRQDD